MRILKWVLLISCFLVALGAWKQGESGVAVVAGLIVIWIYSSLRKLTHRQDALEDLTVGVRLSHPNRSNELLSYSSQSPSHRHWTRGHTFMSGNQFAKAETEFLKSLALASRPIERYFARLGLIDLYYKQRDVRSDAISKCIEICKDQMNDTPAIIEDFEQEWGDPPPAVGSSFERLAIIYEKQGELAKAIEVCEQGIRIGLDGLKVRKARLKKRLEKKRATSE